MGISFRHLSSFNQFREDRPPESAGQVSDLAAKVITEVIDRSGYDHFSHFIVTTTCPDTMAPSIGQALADKYNKVLGNAQIIDMVQGCAGGVSGMILGSQLTALSGKPVLMVNTDAAQKATSVQSKIHRIFGNGAFACSIEDSDGDSRLIHHKSRQYKGLSEVVTVKLGHDADHLIMTKDDIRSDPRKHLGLHMNQLMALRLLRKAEDFYNEFVAESEKPDVLLLHQVNPDIIQKLETLFGKYDLEFVNVADKIGNCGSATTGLAFHLRYEELKGKRVMLCSFGTGGVITAGMWKI